MKKLLISVAAFCTCKKGVETLNNGAPTLDIRAHLNEMSGNNKRTTHQYGISTEVTRHKYILLALMVLSGNRGTQIFLVKGIRDELV